MISDQKSKGEGMAVSVLDPVSAYALWAAEYPPFAHNPLMRAEERALLSLLPSDLRGLAVLDAGCGSGRYLRHARQRGARAVVGVDLSAEMLARARAELRIENEELRMGQASDHSSLVIRHSSISDPC